MRLWPLLLCALWACGNANSQAPDPKAPAGSITQVVVVLKGSDEPLPFDPRGGRITVVTQQITGLIGHPIVLELDTALSPELKASLEETVLASFETIARELAWLQKEEPDLFEKAKQLKRVTCHYDAVAKESDGGLTDSGETLEVKSPPDRFPLLERDVLINAVYDAHVDELDKRFGDFDPTRIPDSKKTAWFDYMTYSIPGKGYLWIWNRGRTGEPGIWEKLRGDHVARIIQFANTVDAKSALGARTRKWLIGEASYVATEQRLQRDYSAWLNKTTLDDDDKLKLGTVLFAFRDSKKLEGFDEFAFGIGIYDAWVAGKVHGELEKLVVCPMPRRGEAETEIHFSCSRFFPLAMGEYKARFADLIVKRNEDHKLYELALLNLGHEQGREGVAFVAQLASHKALFEDGVRLLFHDHQRRDDVRSALEDAAPRWWRDMPSERGLALLIMARRVEGLDPHYADNHWERWTKEFGGPLKRDVMTLFFAEGARAVEMTPKMWSAFAKGDERDQLVAKNLPALLSRDGTKVTAPLVLLRQRYCIEKDANGLSAARSVLDQYSRSHPDAPAAVSNAVGDYTLARCAKPAPSDEDDPTTRD